MEVRIEEPSQVSVSVRTSPTLNMEFGVPQASGGDKSLIYVQAVASDTWSITHNMDKYPSVTVVDSGNTVVIGDIHYIDRNSLVLTFVGAFVGKAYLN